MRQLATRKNTITGMRYGDDATILAWELMNEPREAPDDWIAFAAAAVRAHCRQLVALGDEAARDSARPRPGVAALLSREARRGAAATRSASAARQSCERRGA